jgi:adenylate kinase
MGHFISDSLSFPTTVFSFPCETPRSMLNIVLFGPPGAGKGTQSQKLIARYNLVHLSTGDLLRSQITQGTDLGLRAKKLMDEGLLVPDEVVIGMIESQLANNTTAAGFIFDGFPTRLLERGKTSGRPDDQDEAKIRRRVNVYNTETAQVAGYYAEQQKFCGLNGIGAIEEIFTQICEIIDQKQGASTLSDGAQAADEVKA